MIDISIWTDRFLKALKDSFGGRVCFVGLQGSYARGEATAQSDIDPVVILDALCATDVQAYRAMLDTLPHRELICGFLCGKDELKHWDPSDLFSFYYDTRPIFGSLDAWIPCPNQTAAEGAIRIGACNVFHGCTHNLLHARSEETLRELYKSATFVLRAVCFRQTGRYVSRLEDLAKLLSSEDYTVAKTFLDLKNGRAVDFQTTSEALLAWSQKRIGNADEL